MQISLSPNDEIIFERKLRIFFKIALFTERYMNAINVKKMTKTDFAYNLAMYIWHTQIIEEHAKERSAR